MSSRPLTDPQKRVFQFIRDELEAGLPAPTMRDITAHMGFRSTHSALAVVNALVKKGVIKRTSGVARAIWIPTNPHLAFFKARHKFIEAMHREGSTVQQIVDRICISDRQVEVFIAVMKKEGEC